MARLPEGSSLRAAFFRQFLAEQREERRLAEAEDRRLGNLPPACDRCHGYGVEPHSDDTCWACNGCGEQAEALRWTWLDA
jgi:hypothetical protein